MERKIVEDTNKSKKRRELANAVIKLFKERDAEYYDEENIDGKGERLQRLDDIIEYDQKSSGIEQVYPLMVRKMTDLERINFYEDDLPFLDCRKKT